MPVERHLRENRRRRVALQLESVRAQGAKLKEAMESVTHALRLMQTLHAISQQADDVTLAQLQLALKCLQADAAANDRAALFLQLEEKRR